jgi:hypothetical protein
MYYVNLKNAIDEKYYQYLTLRFWLRQTKTSLGAAKIAFFRFYPSRGVEVPSAGGAVSAYS